MSRLRAIDDLVAGMALLMSTVLVVSAIVAGPWTWTTVICLAYLAFFAAYALWIRHLLRYLLPALGRWWARAWPALGEEIDAELEAERAELRRMAVTGQDGWPVLTDEEIASLKAKRKRSWHDVDALAEEAEAVYAGKTPGADMLRAYRSGRSFGLTCPQCGPVKQGHLENGRLRCYRCQSRLRQEGG